MQAVYIAVVVLCSMRCLQREADPSLTVLGAQLVLVPLDLLLRSLFRNFKRVSFEAVMARSYAHNLPKRQGPMSDIDDLTDRLLKFRDERNWQQFHNSKDLALAITVEAAELLEVFLWKKSEEADKERLKEELADVMAFCLLLAEKEGFDVREILLNKMGKNALKYPIDKSKDTAKKYNEL